MQGRRTTILGKGDQQIQPHAHKTQTQISCKGTDGARTYELYVLSFWGLSLEPCGSWGLSSRVAPRTRVHSIELSSRMFSLPPTLAFPHSALMFFSPLFMEAVGCLMDQITESYKQY